MVWGTLPSQRLQSTGTSLSFLPPLSCPLPYSVSQFWGSPEGGATAFACHSAGHPVALVTQILWLSWKRVSLKGCINVPGRRYPRREESFPTANRALFPGGLAPTEGSPPLLRRWQAGLVVVCPTSHRSVCSNIFIVHLPSVSSYPGAEEKTLRKTHKATILMELTLYGVVRW